MKGDVPVVRYENHEAPVPNVRKEYKGERK